MDHCHAIHLEYVSEYSLVEVIFISQWKLEATGAWWKIMAWDTTNRNILERSVCTAVCIFYRRTFEIVEKIVWFIIAQNICKGEEFTLNWKTC